MLPALKAAREKYERELEPLQAEQKRGENAARRRYVTELDQLQKQLTMQTQFEKASLVKAEKDSIARDIAPGDREPLIPTISAPVAMDATTAFRMRGFFDKLQAATASPRIAKTRASRDRRMGTGLLPGSQARADPGCSLDRWPRNFRRSTFRKRHRRSYG